MSGANGSGRNRRRGRGGGSRSTTGSSGGRGRAQGGAGRRSSGGGRPKSASRRDREAAAAATAVLAEAELQAFADQRRARLLAEERSAARHNERRAQVICVGAGVVVGAVAGVIVALLAGMIAGVVAAVVVTVALAFSVWSLATSLVLRSMGATPLPPGSKARLENLVDGLCATFGLRLPELALVDDDVPNACALGMGPGRATLVVTSGLLETLGLVELEAVVAHELAHIRRNDIVVSSVATLVLGPWIRLLGSDRWLARAMGASRELRADDLAVTATRYPPGLLAALEAMEGAPPPGPQSVFASSAMTMLRPLWVDPDVGRRAQGQQGRLDATAVRAAILAER